MKSTLTNSTIVLKALVAALVVSTACFAASIFFVVKNNATDNQYRQSAGELRVAVHQISARAKDAIAGGAWAFSDLSETVNDFSKNLNQLVSGSDTATALQPSLPDEIGVLESKWKGVKKQVEIIEGRKTSILWLNDIANDFEKSAPEIHLEYQAILDRMSKARSPYAQLAVVQRQQLLVERIKAGFSKLLTSDEAASTTVAAFSAAIAEFNLVHQGLISGNKEAKITRLTGKEHKDSLNRVSQLFSILSEEKDRLDSSVPEFLQAREASELIFSSTPILLAATSGLFDGIRTLASKRVVGTDSAIASGVGMAVALLLIALRLNRSTVQRLRTEKQANDKNQQALGQLLSEISELAEGNLSIEATVSEEFSGAIADSINFTIEQLRAIVSSINETSEKVSEKARVTQDKALALADQSKSQAIEISDASIVVKNMASEMTKMSEEAADSATVAKSSVEIAKSGAKVVKSTISGMDTIREQIQDTAKRIKRLGESSQEIGDIVSLITDIADQTNILALNASIQASMAGDAGRGFAVVADEVQRLAERSSSATRQIENLVRTIRSDTHEAVISMERTTSDVVTGASLTNDAGVALEEIERVSKNISELVEDFSKAANEQAESAVAISRSMADIKDTTSLTAEGTLAAANQVGELSSMTGDLRQSVAGFKLPETIRGGKAKYTDIPTVTPKHNNA